MKVTPVSGFPEWLPEGRIVEQHVLDTLRKSFESYGYASVETRAMEPLEHLLAKGETSKEVYTVSRLQEDEKYREPGMGLHFDLTVPFARYVLENRGKLSFPFKRYQIQKVWRGERPQRGRYREFLQADIDVIGQDSLPLHFDAEIPVLLQEVLGALPIPQVNVHVNNRKLIEGFYRGVGIERVADVLRIVDKLAKIGASAVGELLVGEVGLSQEQAERCLALAAIQATDGSFVERVRALGVSHETLDAGLDELAFVMGFSAHLPRGSVVADLSLARGLDYYTGTVYESFFADNPGVGAVCSGGRYDNLATGGKLRFPGVGVSVGVTRILGVLFEEGGLKASRSTPTCVLVALSDEAARPEAVAVAASLRARGVNTEVFHARRGFGKQIKWASRKGIPYVWFPPACNEDGGHQVRNIRSGEQVSVELEGWAPDPELLLPSVGFEGS